ncbi:MAG: HAD family hydrolase [Thermoplasmata archaeon]|nr:HAD family hydrolase [Thermoplasmata archaeon]
MPARTERPIQSRIKGVIFDLDDTLVLSTVDYVRFKNLIIERIALKGEDTDGYSPDDGIISLITRFRDRMEDKGRSPPEVEIILREFDQIMDDVELERVDETQAIHGARELLALLRDRAVRVGVLTRGCERYARHVLQITDMLDLVDAIECRNSNVPPKPSPEPYWRLAARLGLQPEETVFVGDHLIDAICARSAGVPFIGVRTGDLTEQQLRDAGSAEVFPSVAEMVPWFDEALRRVN